ncbi:hypothetical protein HMPREF9946_05146 [Acetobacteraceae bacterium AT-5844]|nr:hypothetical protein HMPREF9946_05146 [Acetobacteraceae bacterium AT-5844]
MERELNPCPACATWRNFRTSMPLPFDIDVTGVILQISDH